MRKLKFAHKNREIYVGPWLLDPLLLDFGQENPELDFSPKRLALLTLLQQLNPVKRAVFLLREVFGFEYSEVAEIIEKTEANCGKINSRGKARIDLEEQPFHQSKKTESFIHMFLKGIHSGQIDDSFSPSQKRQSLIRMVVEGSKQLSIQL
ncbi:sigma factor-like helix-turn-helix DNA-binding protein [Shimazuella alba]|uniref:RNA polymerase sigma factor 70 region 4 type 2 domain-containing protein n=1 Tax=Shimazuella alba TaxID=2690964 RepID=A0A6I4VRD7_9BACL|nr:sigma factor-like helix-turn-helix DNA-binding protein [Shimazuella alba]MXQ52446.1 hypothetical protein [Shimazuella alba]